LQHEGQVYAVALSADGKTALTVSKDKTARQWETATGKPIGPPLQHQDPVFRVALSADGKIALTRSDRKTARLWETANPVVAVSASPVASAPGVIKVLDFGLAALTAERGGDLTEENAVMGSPDYMAPEQAVDARSADIRADVYSLGCTLFFLLTGEVPYPAATAVSKIVAHREQPLPSIRRARPDVPPELARIVKRLIAKKPKDRYQTPAEVAAALAPFADPPRQTDKRGSKRGWLFAAASLFFGLVLAAGVVVYRIQTDQGELVISTESDDVEVIVRQGGQLVDIIDVKTKKKITLRSGVYDLELTGGQGLKLDITHATLKRGDMTLAKIVRLPSPAPGPVVAVEAPAEIKNAPEKVGSAASSGAAPARFAPGCAPSSSTGSATISAAKNIARRPPATAPSCKRSRNWSRPMAR
jgi:serine/threonine protein kinase